MGTIFRGIQEYRGKDLKIANEGDFYKDSRAVFLRAVSATGGKGLWGFEEASCCPCPSRSRRMGEIPPRGNPQGEAPGVRPLRGPPPPAAVARGPRHFPPHLIRLEICGCAAEQ